MIAYRGNIHPRSQCADLVGISRRSGWRKIFTALLVAIGDPLAPWRASTSLWTKASAYLDAIDRADAAEKAADDAIELGDANAHLREAWKLRETERAALEALRREVRR